MSILIGERLPAQVLPLFTSEPPQRAEGQCFLLVTADLTSQPCACLLSIGEILALNDRSIRILVWPNSRTTANLQRGAPVLLTVAAPPDVFHIRATPKLLAHAPGSPLARFELTITSVEVDGHEGMPVTQPLWFTTREQHQEEVLRMWRDQWDSLRC